MYLAAGLLWVAWCLYWPFLARDHDVQEAVREAEEAYKVCLQQHVVSVADCRRDRSAYEQLLRTMVAPPQENAYQSFASKDPLDAIEFMFALCFLPPLIVFASLRLALEIWLSFAHLRA